MGLNSRDCSGSASKLVAIHRAGFGVSTSVLLLLASGRDSRFRMSTCQPRTPLSNARQSTLSSTTAILSRRAAEGFSSRTWFCPPVRTSDTSDYCIWPWRHIYDTLVHHDHGFAKSVLICYSERSGQTPSSFYINTRWRRWRYQYSNTPFQHAAAVSPCDMATPLSAAPALLLWHGASSHNQPNNHHFFASPSS